jgi:hypothetical protein
MVSISFMHGTCPTHPFLFNFITLSDNILRRLQFNSKSNCDGIENSALKEIVIELRNIHHNALLNYCSAKQFLYSAGKIKPKEHFFMWQIDVPLFRVNKESV